MKLHSLDKLFSRFTFVTPDYQRGYAWGESHVIDFWEDICRIGIANPQHFTGTLILEVIPGEATRIDATVVDGQQRLTTVVLLATVIAERLAHQDRVDEATAFRTKFIGSKDAPAFRYGAAHDTWPYLALHIFKDTSAVARAAEYKSAYIRNLESALTKLRERVDSLSNDDLERLVSSFRDKLVFNVVEVDPRNFNIHVAFESINHRGKQLTRLELLKNRLIYVATVMRCPVSETEDSWNQKKDTLRKAVNSTWGDVYSWLGREGKDALDEEEFLRTHAIMYFPVDTGEKDWLETLLFRNRFAAAKAMNGDLSADEVHRYLDSLRLSAVLWSHLQRPRNMPAPQAHWLNRINHVRRPLFDAVLLAAYVRLVKDDIRLAVDLRRTAKIEKPFVSLLTEIERFIVLVFLVTGRRSHTGRKDFAAVANEFHDQQGPYAGDTATALKYLARYIRACVSNIHPDDPDSYYDPDFEWSGWMDLGAFHNDITKVLRHGEGYYGHLWTRVLLFEYEESLRNRDGGDAKVPWDQVSADSIEHVYPQDDTHWQALTKALGGGRRKARVNSYRHSVGNLVLLNQRKNSSLANLPYTGKDAHRAKRLRFEQGSYSETDIASNYKTWTQRAIESRGEALLKFAEQRWDFSFEAAGLKYKSLLVIA